MEKEEIRKGPWIEQEDVQLICFVGLFGDRRWEFIAQVSGLNRTGKSCRLRWVNYLQPGLKRGKMTPQEEELVIELQSKWGNRWSRIARKLPGRTDNEIKNYWRTYTRKKTHKKKRGALSPTSSPSNCGSSATSNLTADSLALQDAMGDPGKGCSMEDIWEDIVFTGENSITPASYGYTSYNFSYQLITSQMWQPDSGTLWRTEKEDSTMLDSSSYQFYSSY